ncbi:MAG: type II toxin-antitoxin system Phd/YefM family antitoxin [Chloroflexi bacterium]|nr:type II toxin-antitoxin system Phd/YefM family antitoxin [Chloroflexota bacterium]
MVKKVSAAEAKAKLSALVAEVAFGGQRIIIERRGKAMAAMVNVKELELLGQEHPKRPAMGALSLVGAWKEVPEEKLDELLSDIYEARQKDTGRPVSLER